MKVIDTYDPFRENSMSDYSEHMNKHNIVFAIALLIPAIYALGSHWWQGLLLMGCVVAGRYSARGSRETVKSAKAPRAAKKIKA